MAELRQAESAMLGVARRGDFDLLRKEWAGVRLEVAGRIEGLDVGHGRWQEQVLFRPRALRPRAAGAGGGVDRRGGAP